jgi:hypothetical protein
MEKDCIAMNKNTADLLTSQIVGYNILQDCSNVKLYGFPVVISELLEDNCILGFGKCAELIKIFNDNKDGLKADN